MTLYHVHLFREMRLYFPGIEALSPEEAAKIAAGRPTENAEHTEDCQGENLAALIDVAGDDEFSQSTLIDFEGERLRKATRRLLAALDYLLAQTVDQDLKYGIGLTEGEDEARAQALAAIAEATGCVPAEPRKPIVIEVRRGVVQDVSNLPPDYVYELKDWDDRQANENAEARRPA